MFPDHYDVEPFNPFNVGPANNGGPSEFQIPTSVTYPPPVFVAKPEYVKAAKEQVALRSSSKDTLKLAKSKHGEVAISKAIKNEMAVAKQQAAAIHETDRIDPDVKLNVKHDLKAKKKESKASIRTLLPVRSNRQASGAGNAKRTTSGLSVATKQRKSSRVEIAAKASKISNELDAKSPKPFEPAKMSFTSIKSKSTKSVVSETSTGSSSSEQSETTDKSESDSQHTLKSSEPADKNTSVVAPKSKTTVKEDRNYPVSESSLSYGKPLTEQAADLAFRLNSGNENYRRYNSVVRNHSTTIPQKLSEGDRMSFWFSDAVLS
ncbi:neurofilament heavy polypeptide [Drosophila kikkawai]|uniref:Neurofilament heavy polypeptide n=1 Tax=Drosophila kikkawai TaxID=30033 RepID=A0A6P4JDK8_DROKI|nr:uncharacterized protein LOC108081974 [Drosophila kikkawai]KAH8334524.1 hypothetical protein KR059_011092 [Drosophila kikkawai]